MDDSIPNRSQAAKILSEVVAFRQNGTTPFSKKYLDIFILHSYNVAKIAEKIASRIDELDQDKAYVLGLLHDCGRYRDEWSEPVFHGLEGYKYLMAKGYPSAARIALSHSFFDLESNFSAYKMVEEDSKLVMQILRNTKFDDYDYLIQLADMLNDCGNFCTIEDRFKSILTRHTLSEEYVKKSIESLTKIKDYFDKKARCNIYELIGLI